MRQETISPEKRLMNGTIVYAIGMFANNALSVLLIPVITRLLTPGEYGYYELAISTITLIIPVVTLQSLEALFRLLFSAQMQQKRTYITIIFGICLFGLAAGCIVFLLLAAGNPQIQYPMPVALFTVTQVLYMFYQKVARAEGRNKLFAMVGILQTAVLLLTQLVLLFLFHMKADALLIAGAFSFAVACVVFESKLRALPMLSPRLMNRADLGMILRFSIPLIPNTISWWLIASLNRYFLLGKRGMAAVGIYSMALKFSFLVTAMAQVFNMAWQESAIAEHQMRGTDGDFNSRTFRLYMQALLSLIMVLIPLTRLIMPYVVGAEFQPASALIPPLYLVAVFEAFMTFWSAGYFVHKRTMGAFVTTMAGAAVNIALVLCLIDAWGMFAPVAGALVAFMLIWVLRAHTLRDVLKIHIDIKQLSLLLALVCAAGAGYYLLPYTYMIPLLLATTACAICVNRRWLVALYQKWFERKSA